MYNYIMYIIELIAKLIQDKKASGKDKAIVEEQMTEVGEKCSHIFLPIDSTNEILACTKCGLVVNVKNQKIKQRNPFN